MAFTFGIPAGVTFTCSRCGDCCRNVNVLLMPGEREMLASLDWTGREDDLVGAATTTACTDAAQRGKHRLAAREDGACPYLGAHQQCRIHEHFGGDAKPLTCRLFPFGFRAVGEHVGVDVAFSCRAVAEGLGAPVEESLREWMAKLAKSGAGDGRPPLLSSDRKLTAEVASQIERTLTGFLADREMSVPQRVRCALAYMSLATTGDPATAAAATLRQVMASALPARIRRESPDADGMDPTQRAVFRQWMFLALNPAPAGFQELPRAKREREVARREVGAIAFRDHVGAPWMDSKELTTTFAAIDAVDPGPLRMGPEWIATFLSAKISGWRFLAAGPAELPLIAATRVLFLCHPMIAWAAKALAAERGLSVVTESDVRGAVRLIDRSFGQTGTAMLPRPQAKAFEWTMQETDLIAAAWHEVVG